MQGHPIKKQVLYGKYEVLEGPEVQGVVILEFPTVSDAKAYYGQSCLSRSKGTSLLGCWLSRAHRRRRTANI